MRNFQCLSAPTTLFFSALLSLLLFFAQAVNAADYSFTDNSYYLGPFPSAQQSCDAAAQHSLSSYPGKSITGKTLTSQSATNFKCNVTYNGAPYSNNFSIIRSGTSCPANHTYNSSTGECEAPEPEKCEPTIGKRVNHWHNSGKLGAAAVEPPGSVCEASCQYANTWERKCDREISSDSDDVMCNFVYLGNGIECTEGDKSNPSAFDIPPTKPPETREPTREHEQKCDNWVTGADGVARRTCTSKDEYKDPGELKCENTNGYLKCAPGTPPPAYTKTETTAESSKTDNADGSSKTETTTNKDVTNCHGAKPCNTTSTEKTETENTNPDGSPGDKTTTCKGDKCTTDEDPKPGTDPDAEEEGEDDKSSVSGGAVCDSPPVCDGDAIQCAILRQQFTQRCADEKFREVTPENTNALKTDLDAAFSGEQFQPITATAENTFSLEGMIDTTSRFSSSCPVLPSVSYSWVDGSSQSFNPNFADLCQYLRWMGFLLVAFAMRSAAEIIAGGLK